MLPLWKKISGSGKDFLIPNLNQSAPALLFRYYHGVTERPEQALGSGPHQLSILG